MRVNTRCLAAIGVVGALGTGAVGGLVTPAGAAARPLHVRVHGTATPVSTASFTFNVSITGRASGTLTVTGNGQADFANDTASLTVNIPGVLAKRIPGGSDSPEVINAVLSGGTVYLEIPSLASLVGEPWISVTVPARATSAVQGGFNKIAAALGDVNGIVRAAQTRHAMVTSLGSSTVNGVAATGTQIVLTHSNKRSGGTRTRTVSLWADSSDRLVQGDVTVAGAGKAGQVGRTATLDVSGYGDPVTITVPPASQVRAIPLSTIAAFLGKSGHHGHFTGHAGHSWHLGLLHLFAK